MKKLVLSLLLLLNLPLAEAEPFISTPPAQANDVLLIQYALQLHKMQPALFMGAKSVYNFDIVILLYQNKPT